MSIPSKCPGQNTMFWRPEDIFEISCPHCGHALEFFKTDVKRPCPRCGEKVLNPRMDFSCAAWCEAAEECLGPEVYCEWMERQELEKRKKADLEQLMEPVHPEDQEVKALFNRLFEENTNPEQLLDVKQLRLLQGEDDRLLEKAVRYWKEFVERQREKIS